MPNFRQPDKSVSRAFVQNGIYVGNVTRIDEASQQIYVEIPRYVAGFEFGPLNVACSDLPAVGDSVACLFLENKQEDVMILGVVKNADSDVTVTPIVATSTTHPDSPKVGTILYETDTEDIYVWNGTEWLTFFEVNLPATIYADLQGTAASATFASSVADNSVVLGGDTTGDYVSTITAGNNMSISAGSGTGEGSTPTLATSTTPSFSTITSTVATGTAPLTIASETLVTNLNADRLDGEHGSWYSPSGLISPYAGLTAPPGWLFCNGQSVSRTTYATLFSTLTATVGTCTITTASPAVVSLTAHGLVEGDAIYFTTTGALPTGLTANTTYYVKSTGNANTFQVSLTRTSSATAFTAGTAVNTTVAGSGTHTVVKAPYGVPSSLNFYVPDFRGRTPVGIDNIGGTDAGLLSLTNALGGAGGVQTVTLDDTQIPTHVHGATGLTIGTTGSTHSHDAGNYDGSGINNAIVDNSSGPIAQYQGLYANSGSAANARIKATASADSAHSHNITGSTAGLTGAGQLHDNMQPFMLVNYIIKT